MKRINLPKNTEFEKIGINVFNLCDFESKIKNVSRETLKMCDWDDDEINTFINKIHHQILNIPKTTTHKHSLGETTYYFNDFVILNNYPLFEHYYLGDCVCIFLIRYYTPCVWDNKIYMIDCDGDINESDDMIFLSMYYDDDILTL